VRSAHRTDGGNVQTADCGAPSELGTPPTGHLTGTGPDSRAFACSPTIETTPIFSADFRGTVSNRPQQPELGSYVRMRITLISCLLVLGVMLFTTVDPAHADNPAGLCSTLRPLVNAGYSTVLGVYGELGIRCP